MARTVHLLLVLAALAGCSATRGSASHVAGGTAPDADARRVERLERIGSDLAGSAPTDEHVDIALSTRDALGAWSWPDGRIRVSRALVDALDDDELRAAVAHEMGHLLDAGAVADRATALAGAIDGGPYAAADIETRADAFACGLLRARGASVAALPRMLRAVASRASGDDTIDPARLLARARVTERRCAASP